MESGRENLLKTCHYIKENILKMLCQYKYYIIGILAIFCMESYLSFQFYSKEPDFPVELFYLDSANAILRDLLLAGMLVFFQKNSLRVKQIIKAYFPVVIISVFWLSISAIFIYALKLVFNTATILSVLAGAINNIILVLLAGCLYIKYSNTVTKLVYFLSYFFTILVFYSDTLYFFVTSTHIQRVVFDNLNIYSITGVLANTNKIVLFSIVASFLLLLMLFRTPQKIKHWQTRTSSVVIIIVFCLITNFANIAAVELYPKVLYANGFDEEGELEKSRNLSRDLISESVTVNLVKEFFRDEVSQVTKPTQYQREAFTENEKQLLSSLGISVDKNSAAFEKAYPYEKVIVIVAESFHRDYLHYYNSRIPAETTQFLDDLIAKYPHVDNYYTSNRPTTQGLNSMFLSQVFYSEEQGFENNATIFRALEKNGYHTMFMESTSQYYNDEFRVYKKRFGMQEYRAKEDLEKQGYTGSIGWGFHNDVMYEETLRVLEENKNNKLFLVTKTIDLHQPYPYCGFSRENLPPSIADSYNYYLKSIYWENICLKNFFHDLEERKLLDDKTLIIVTSDHNPHPSQDEQYKTLGTNDIPSGMNPIPLIFVSNNLQPFENFNNAVLASQIDFAPTLLGLLKIPSPAEFAGRNMIAVPEGHGYAIGCYDGETIFYKSKADQMKVNLYKENEDASEQAFIHWMKDSYMKYFQGSLINVVSRETQIQQ